MDMLLYYIAGCFGSAPGAFSLINYSIIFAERFYGSNKTADVIKHTHSQCTFLFSLYILHAVLFSFVFIALAGERVTCTRYTARVLCIGCLEILALCESEYHKSMLHN